MASRIPAHAVRTNPAQVAAARAAVKSELRRDNRPSILREICYGLTVAVAAGAWWKYQHLKQRRHVEEFYDLLDKGNITVVVDEKTKRPLIRS